MVLAENFDFVVLENNNPIFATNSNLTPEQSADWWVKYNIYKKIKDNPEQFLGDSLVFNFYTHTSNEPIGKLEDVKQHFTDSIYQDSLGHAMLAQLNGSIIPNNPMEAYYQEVNAKYIDINSLPTDSILDSTFIEPLKTIAILCPTIYGPAVYFARAILQNLELEPNVYQSECEQLALPNSNNRISSIIEARQPEGNIEFPEMPTDETMLNSNPEKIEFNIYPNPAFNNVTVTTTSTPKSILFALILDNLGNEIHKYDLNQSISNELDVSNLSNGLYSLKIYNEYEILNIKKLTIIK